MDDAFDSRNISDSMWRDFTVEMDSSSLAVMQRLVPESNYMYEESNVEADADVEVRNGNEESDAEADAVEIMNGNEEEDAAETMNGNEKVWVENYANEVTIGDAPENITSMNEVISGESNAIEEEINESTLENEVESSVCGEETEYPPKKIPYVKMKHFLSYERYLYVLELYEAIEEEKMEDEGNSPQRNYRKIDPSCTFYFSSMHKHFVVKYVSLEEKDFTSLIEESIPTDYICVFETCKERFIEKYKPKTFTALGFIRFCAAIAYLGVYCSSRSLDTSAKGKAINYMCSLMYDLIQRDLFKQLSKI